MRAVQKHTWATVSKMCDGLLDVFVTGEGSIARVLETSRKLSLIFEQVQAGEFARNLRNFAFALQRFDSASLPLFKILKMLPCVFRFLVKVAALDDVDDASWARDKIARVTGNNAYRNILRCAMVCDGMATCQRFLRLCDKADNDACCSGREARGFFACLRTIMCVLVFAAGTLFGRLQK